MHFRSHDLCMLNSNGNSELSTLSQFLLPNQETDGKNDATNIPYVLQVLAEKNRRSWRWDVVFLIYSCWVLEGLAQ